MFKVIVFVGEADTWKSTFAKAFQQYSMTHVKILDFDGRDWSDYKDEIKDTETLAITTQVFPGDDFAQKLGIADSKLLFIHCYTPQ